MRQQTTKAQATGEPPQLTLRVTVSDFSRRTTHSRSFPLMLKTLDLRTQSLPAWCSHCHRGGIGHTIACRTTAGHSGHVELRTHDFGNSEAHFCVPPFSKFQGSKGEGSTHIGSQNKLDFFRIKSALGFRTFADIYSHIRVLAYLI